MTAAIIAAVIIIDQIIKFWVKTHFYLGESVTVTSWFKLLFIENNGMAFGMEIGSKLFLTLFRLLAVGALIWYISRLIRRNADVSTGYLVCLSLITAGAAGNIFDCVFMASSSTIRCRLKSPLFSLPTEDMPRCFTAK